MTRITNILAVTCTAALALGLATLSPLSASADVPVPPIAVTTSAPVLELPSTDGYLDTSTITVTTTATDPVNVELEQNGTIVHSVAENVPVTTGTNGTSSASVALQDSGLSAGDYTVVAISTADSTVTASTDITIGSGVATAVTLVTTNGSDFYPQPDGYLDAVQGTVSAVDATGTAVPFIGTIGAGTASTMVTGSGASPTSFSLSLVGQPVSTENLIATATNGGVQSNSVALTLHASTIQSVSVSRQYATVYPHVDGYRDTDVITVQVASTLPSGSKITGSLREILKGKTVGTWTLSHTGATAIKWNGLDGHKLKSGTYSFVASAKSGNTVTSSVAKIVVSKKKLVEKKTTSSKVASSVIRSYEAFDDAQESECLKTHSGKIGCFGYELPSDPDHGNLSLIAHGTVAVPSKVRSAIQYRTPRVRVTADSTKVVGTAVWGYGLSDDENAVVGTLHVGKHSLGWHSLGGTSSSLEVAMGLGAYSYFETKKFSISYEYWVLK